MRAKLSSSQAAAGRRRHTSSPSVRTEDGIGNQERQRARRDGMRYPHEDEIRRGLGTNFAFRAVHDSAGCTARRTLAFTDGGVAHFAEKSPSLHVAAHEAAHQLQHAGRSNDAGLGAEGHAAAVADRIVQGRSAKKLIGSRGRRGHSEERGYVETDENGNWDGVQNTRGGCRMADNGQTLTLGKQLAWAEPGLIQSANAQLQAHHSGIAISAGEGGRVVKALDGSFHQLSRVKMTPKSDPQSDQLYDDCGRLAREIMGPGNDHPANAVTTPGGMQMDVPPVLARKTPKEQLNLTLMIDKELRALPNYPNVTEEDKRKAAQKAYNDYLAKDRYGIDNIEQQNFARNDPPLSREKAQELGMDAATVPEVGEAYSIVRRGKTSYGDAPYHWAAVIMAAGGDRVTLENFGVNENRDDTRNTQWYFQTYGTAKGQTFHEKWENMFGDDPHTLRMRTQTPLEVQAPTARSYELLELFANGGDETVIRDEIRKRAAWIDVTVKATDDTTSDDVYVAMQSAGGMVVQTGVVQMERGMGHIFVLPLRALGWPLPSTLVVRVFDHEALGSDDLIGTIHWAWPLRPRTAKLSNGTASYDVVISL